MKNEENRLIKKLKAGDEEIFKRLFYLYSDRLFIWAYKITCDSLASADIVQDFFVRCWEKRDILPNNCSFKAYAYKSVYNASLNYLRDNKRFVHGYEITIDLIDDDVRDEDIEELKRLLLKAIDELPDRCKKIFVMTTLEKKKYAEVADLLGISVNTVKVQVSKAYRILKEKIG
ncbi:RNA polymerase sigma-70 factor [uncultured Proteiniphilum sp.]|uniref:RNA polymerase sigma factor n=1 Tax=uncultured Proteiniphilum sp. TaxID=497637 RepID=UPI00261147ED|nr:RNA polymerase sigma-70 factor [uncultured Proteiniphilum sp.]